MTTEEGQTGLEPIAPLRGMRDVMPAEYDQLSWLRNRIIQSFERYGYRGIDLPVIENADLYWRKSGLEVMEKLYEFTDQGNRNVALRPELTASAARAFVTSREPAPLPERWFYVGPAFRYDKPQKGRYRQFTHVGVELLGSDSATADAEIVALTCDSLEAIGLRSYALQIGHMGLVREFLESLNLTDRERSEFMAGMEESAADAAEEAVENSPIADEVWPAVVDAAGRQADAREFLAVLGEVLAQQGAERNGATAAAVVTATLSALKTELFGARTSDEIAGRLMRKIEGMRPSPDSLRAQQFVTQLRSTSGPPNQVLDRIRDLTRQHQLSEEPVRRLEAAITAMEALGVGPQRMIVDFGFGRGLEYYTGLVFEINCDWLGAQRQVCGGGRYDGLVQLVGGAAPIPACGFAFGLERLLLALQGGPDPLPSFEPKGPQLLVIYMDDESMGYAVDIAQRLRREGLRVELALEATAPTRAVSRAGRLSIPGIVVIGEEERRSGTIKLRWQEKGRKRETELRAEDLSAVITFVRGQETVNG